MNALVCGNPTAPTHLYWRILGPDDVQLVDAGHYK
jgi:hypothetical protein